MYVFYFPHVVVVVIVVLILFIFVYLFTYLVYVSSFLLLTSSHTPTHSSGHTYAYMNTRHTFIQTHTNVKCLYVVLPLTRTTKPLHQIQIITSVCDVVLFSVISSIFCYTYARLICLICHLFCTVSHCTNKKTKMSHTSKTSDVTVQTLNLQVSS